MEWIIRKKISDDLAEQLLSCRNIKLSPDYETDLRDPFALLDMDKATEKILSAIKNNERVVIFGDYDADGVCASIIVQEFFKKIDFQNFHVHIPDRHLDGYGMTLESLDEFAKQNVKLIITLDCGITDFEEVKRAKDLGMEVVIIDHHIPPGKLPEAFAIIDPKRKDDNYFFKDLCGAGLAFKTIQAMAKKMEIGGNYEKWLLDLVAIASVSDMVPLIDENRTLVFYGLKVLRKTKRQGVISLCQRTGLNLSNINEDDVGFTLGPRINAASRMEHANTSFELLATNSKEEADWLAARVEMMNVQRKKLVENILSEIDKKFEDMTIPSIITIGDLNWNPGILGLIAARVAEKYNCPVILWGKANAKEIKASCRSDGSIDLSELMKNLSEDVVFDFGGHSMAGGFSVHREKISDLEKEVLRAWGKIPKKKIDSETLHIDKEILLEEINEDFYSIIEKFQPFGIGNPKPNFLFRDIEIKNARTFGNGGLHLQLDFDSASRRISAIGFFMGNLPQGPSLSRSRTVLEELKPGQKIDLVATLEKSYFRLPPELRLRIVDVKLR